MEVWDLPANEHIAALRCRLIVSVINGRPALWRPFALFWFFRASNVWNLGLGLFDPAAAGLRLRANLPSHWDLAFKAYKKVKVSLADGPHSLLRWDDIVALSASHMSIFYNQCLLSGDGRPLGGSYWKPVAVFGITKVKDVIQANIDSLPLRLRRKVLELRALFPLSWQREGPIDGASFEPLSYWGWKAPDSPPLGDDAWVSAVSATTRDLRRRMWSNVYGLKLSLANFIAPKCWRGPNAVFLTDGFDWKLAFTRLWRKGRPPLSRGHTEAVFKVLHGLYMTHRPVGIWGFPTCPNCSVLTDSSHALSCSAHASALRWFWRTTEAMVGCSVDQSWGALLGGTVPVEVLRGFNGLAYAWEVFRISFLSSLYRMWVRAAASVHSLRQANILTSSPPRTFYEGRNVILSCISAVREVITLDARRASDSVIHFRRDGTRTALPRRYQSFLSSWVEAGWIEGSFSLDDFRYSILLSPSFPVPVNLSGLLRTTFPTNGNSR